MLLGLLKLNGFWKCLWMCSCLWFVLLGLLFIVSVMWWILVLFVEIGCSMWKNVIDSVRFGNRFRLKLMFISECMMWCILFGVWCLVSFVVSGVKCLGSGVLLFLLRLINFGISIVRLWLLLSLW